MGAPNAPASQRRDGQPIEQVTIHPVLDKAYVSAEHPEGQLDWLGDALGRDFMMVRFQNGWASLHQGSGTRNEDWFGWGANVLAPCDGVVTHVREPEATNTPGSHSGGQAGRLVVERADGVAILVAHIMNPRVREGESVVAGQVIAQVGNNGSSWAPHIHVGAWRGDQPLQVRVDLAALGRLLRDQGEEIYYGVSSS